MVQLELCPECGSRGSLSALIGSFCCLHQPCFDFLCPSPFSHISHISSCPAPLWPPPTCRISSHAHKLTNCPLGLVPHRWVHTHTKTPSSRGAVAPVCLQTHVDGLFWCPLCADDRHLCVSQSYVSSLNRKQVFTSPLCSFLLWCLSSSVFSSGLNVRLTLPPESRHQTNSQYINKYMFEIFSHKWIIVKKTSKNPLISC